MSIVLSDDLSNIISYSPTILFSLKQKTEMLDFSKKLELKSAVLYNKSSLDNELNDLQFDDNWITFDIINADSSETTLIKNFLNNLYNYTYKSNYSDNPDIYTKKELLSILFGQASIENNKLIYTDNSTIIDSIIFRCRIYNFLKTYLGNISTSGSLSN